MLDFHTIGMTADTLRSRRRFAAVQAAKALLGATLVFAYVVLVHHLGLTEIFSAIGLAAPSLLAGLAFTKIPLDRLETMSLGVLAVVIGYLAALTGGIESPLLIWFVLVPAEAALAGGRRKVELGGLLAGSALLALALLHGLGVVHFSAVPAWPLFAVSALAATAQAAALAIAAQDRQREADRAATEGTAMYRFLADNAMDLITRHGADGRIRFASPAAQPILGITPESLVGHAPSTLAHPDDLKIMQQAFIEASYFGRAATAEVRLKRADGDYVWTEMRCRPALESAGRAADIVAVTRDISERKAHERALIDARDLAEQASRAKSRFLANMSHELRTPLNAIIGFSEVMTHEMFGPLGVPRYNEYARLIHESGGHLLELINGILDMSKIEAGKFKIAEETFDLEDAAAQTLRFVKIQADRKGVFLRMRVTPEAKIAFADRRAVKQMLVNLISNGVKFTPRAGEVSVECLRSDGGIEIKVTDTGVGISARDLERLGQPFEQVDGALVRAQEGTGLGLALVKALTQMHGGEAVIDSTLGVGTTVRVRLPHAAVTRKGDVFVPDHLQEVAQPLKGAA